MRYIRGHNRRGKKFTPEQIEKISMGTRIGNERMHAEGRIPVVRREAEHPAWKGHDATYSTIHWWLRRFKKWGVCWNCGRDDVRTQWANVSGDYRREREDYVELCCSCHKLSHLHGWDLGPIVIKAIAAGWYQ